MIIAIVSAITRMTTITDITLAAAITGVTPSRHASICLKC